MTCKLFYIPQKITLTNDPYFSLYTISGPYIKWC